MNRFGYDRPPAHGGPRSRFPLMLRGLDPAAVPRLAWVIRYLVHTRNAERVPTLRIEGSSLYSVMARADHDLVYWCALLAHGLPLPEGVDGRISALLLERARVALDD